MWVCAFETREALDLEWLWVAPTGNRTVLVLGIELWTSLRALHSFVTAEPSQVPWTREFKYLGTTQNAVCSTWAVDAVIFCVEENSPCLLELSLAARLEPAFWATVYLWLEISALRRSLLFWSWGLCSVVSSYLACARPWVPPWLWKARK